MTRFHPLQIDTLLVSRKVAPFDRHLRVPAAVFSFIASSG